MIVKGVESNEKVHPILVDANGNQKVIPTDGTDAFLIEIDDADIAGAQKMQVVICLQYVYDAANTKWVRKPL